MVCERHKISYGDTTVSGLFRRPEGANAMYVFAHGAGAGMEHVFMERYAELFADSGIATLRFQFPYMEAGSKRPDRAPVCIETVRHVLAFAKELAPDLPLFAGGKSMGGRMTSMALAEQDDKDVQGLIFFGFPLHPAKKPATERAEHLRQVRPPMFFVQGTRDALADMNLLRGVWQGLGDRIHTWVMDTGDHGLQVLKRSGVPQEEAELGSMKAIRQWIDDVKVV